MTDMADASETSMTALDLARRDVTKALSRFELSPLGEAVDGFAALRGMIDAAQARRVAAAQADEATRGDGRRHPRSGRGRRATKTSKRQKGLDEARGTAVGANPALGDMVEQGELSGEQLDTIAAAMETDHAAATDQDLIDAVAGASVEQGRRIGRDWAAQRTDKAKQQREHDRQRARRNARSWTNKEGLGVLLLEGDTATINRLWQTVLSQEQQLWRSDGGRDLQVSEHPRTRTQRLFDAAVSLFLGSADGAARKPAAVLTIAADADRCAELIGHGPVADSVIAELLAESMAFLQITDLKHKPLWWGRVLRNASVDQFLALVVRDKGCVRCNAPWQQCEAHHLAPWGAPLRGPTDIDNLALLCSSCHHHLHGANLTLEQLPDGTWSTRPATAAETPPRPARRRPG